MDKDVLGKADALLRRHNSAIGTDTGAVPLLTELVDSPDAIPGPADDLAQQVFQRVMGEVEGRLAHQIEGRILQHLVPQVHAAVASALGDMHQELANAVGDAVTEALRARQVK